MSRTPALALLATLAFPPATEPASPSPSPRVFTEEDLARTRGASPSPSPARKGPQPSARPSPATSAPMVHDTRDADEKRWRARAAAARKAIADAEARVVAAEARLVAARQDRNPLENLQDPNREQTRQAQISAAQVELETAKAAVLAAQRALADLEDTARRENVPPGWLRER
jgi:hypothetical protein